MSNNNSEQLRQVIIRAGGKDHVFDNVERVSVKSKEEAESLRLREALKLEKTGRLPKIPKDDKERQQYEDSANELARFISGLPKGANCPIPSTMIRQMQKQIERIRTGIWRYDILRQMGKTRDDLKLTKSLKAVAKAKVKRPIASTPEA